MQSSLQAGLDSVPAMHKLVSAVQPYTMYTLPQAGEMATTKSRKAKDGPRTVSVREARQALADLLNRAHYLNERITITRNGRVVAGIVGELDLERLTQPAA